MDGLEIGTIRGLWASGRENPKVQLGFLWEAPRVVPTRLDLDFNLMVLGGKWIHPAPSNPSQKIERKQLEGTQPTCGRCHLLKKKDPVGF